MYLAVATQPDIAVAVNTLARFVENPGQIHWMAIKHLMRYLKGTMDYGLIYQYGQGMDVRLTAYSDADWAGDTSDRKSTTGYIIQLGCAVVCWKSIKQHCVALSTVEAEYIAASMASKEIIWMCRLLDELGFKQIDATVLKMDNSGACELASNAMISQRTKHIDI